MNKEQRRMAKLQLVARMQEGSGVRKRQRSRLDYKSVNHKLIG